MSTRTSRGIPRTWAWASMRPGMMVLPVMSSRRASSGMATEADGPTASMRLPLTTTVAFSITSSPRIVTTVPPVSAMRPSGVGMDTTKLISVVRARWSSPWSGASGPNTSESSRRE